MTTGNSLIIQQGETGYRYSVEPFLLAHSLEPKSGSRILDVGTGCGVIPLLLAHRTPRLRIVGVEIQSSLFRQAVSNVAENGENESIQLVEADFLEFSKSEPTGSFDYLVSNPPYRKINSGRRNPCQEKAVARHELTLTLTSLLAAGIPLLKKTGRMWLAYPFDRKTEVLKELCLRGLVPRQVIHILGHTQAEPRMFLVEGALEGDPGALQESTLTLYESDGSYTREMKEIYASFDYSGRSHRVREE